MNSPLNGHLNPKEMNDWLLGITGSDSVTHLDECSQCRADIEAMSQTLGLFREAAVEWSEEASRKLSFHSQAPREEGLAFSPWLRPVVALVTAALLVAVALPFAARRGMATNRLPG